VAPWRTIRARDRREPAGFIRPCQPVPAHQIPTGDEWIHELKWDGYRLIARCERSVVYLWSRTGRNWAKDFPLIGAAMARLPVESVILDGEAVCLLEDGRPDFHALRSRHACRDARLIAYDLLALDGEDLRKMPLHERRRRLEGLLSGDDVIRFSGNVEGPREAALFWRACAMGLEGIVSKRINAPYRSGPFLGWRKIKCPGYARP
jgi:bifunctional non-homologous end joining protein LigD